MGAVDQLGTKSPGFPTDYRQLLLALAEQHERDVAEAGEKAKLEMSLQPKACDALQQTGNATVANTSPQPPMLNSPATPEDELTAEEMHSSANQPNRDSTSSDRSLNSAEKLLALKAQKLSVREQYDKTTEELNSKRDVISRFVRAPAFDKISAVLLLLNAVFIGVQVEMGYQDTTPVEIDIIDYIFCACFLTELGLRLWGYGFRHFFCDPEDRSWNVFDFLIVVLSTTDTLISASSSGAGEESPLGNLSVLRIIRVVRIIRVIRIIRVMKFFQDLRILLSAIASTVKTASFALTLIFFTMYMFGIAISQLSAEIIKQKRADGFADPEMEFFFGSLIRTILALFMTIAGGIDWKDAAVPLFEVGALATTFFLLYVCIMIFCVMNVLMGIFCQCAIDSANSDREKVIEMQLQDKTRFIKTLEAVFAGWDENGDGKCSFDEFSSHIEDSTLQALLRSLDIEPRDAMMLFELCDEDKSGEVDLNEFVTGCITLRGGAKAVHMEKVTNMNKLFGARFDDLDAKVEQVYKESEFWKLVVTDSRRTFDHLPPTPPVSEKTPSAPHVALSYLPESLQRRNLPNERVKEYVKDHPYQSALGAIYCGEEV